jgi:hypothetical protein
MITTNFSCDDKEVEPSTRSRIGLCLLEPDTHEALAAARLTMVTP